MIFRSVVAPAYVLVSLIWNCAAFSAWPNQTEFNLKVLDLPDAAKSASGQHVDLGYKFDMLGFKGEWVGYVDGTHFLRYKPGKDQELLRLLGRDPSDVPTTPWSLLNFRLAIAVAFGLAILKRFRPKSPGGLDQEIAGLYAQAQRPSAAQANAAPKRAQAHAPMAQTQQPTGNSFGRRH